MLSWAIIPNGIPAGKYPTHYALTQNTSPSDAAVRARLEADWKRESDKRVASMRQFLTLMLCERGDKIVAAAAAAATAASNTTGKDPARIAKDAAANAAAQAALNNAFDSLGIEIDSAGDRLPFPMPPVKDDHALREEEEEARPMLDAYEVSHGAEYCRQAMAGLVCPHWLVHCDERVQNALGFAIAEVPFREQKIQLKSECYGLREGFLHSSICS